MTPPRKVARLPVALAVLLAGLLASACGSSGAERTILQITVDATNPQAVPTLSGFEVTLTLPDVANAVSTQTLSARGLGTLNALLPANTGGRVDVGVTAFDVSGNAVLSGSRCFALIANAVNQVTVTLDSPLPTPAPACP